MSFNHKKLKTLFIIIGVILIAMVLVISIISPVTKNYIEKYDTKFIGREISIGRAYVNPLSGFIQFNDIIIFESKSDIVFFSARKLSLHIALLKLLFKTIEISDITLTEPIGMVIQENQYFNFDDILKKFKTNKTPSTYRFNLLQLKVINGEIHYRENQFPINYFIKNIKIESPGKRWDSDTISANFSFNSGVKTGEMKADISINMKTMNYRFNAVVNKYNLAFLEPYLKDIADCGNISAILDADIHSNGQFPDQENVTNSGIITVSDFHFGKDSTENFASFDKLVIAIKEMSPKKLVYNYDSILLSHPYFKYEQYDKLNNLETVFGMNGIKIIKAQADTSKFNVLLKIKDYLKVLSKNFAKSDYKVGRIAVKQGIIQYNDYSLSEKIAVELNPLNLQADSIDKTHKHINVNVNSGIEPSGNLSIALEIHPKDSSDFDLKIDLRQIPVSLVNPFLMNYTSFPLDRGTLEFTGNWKVRKGIINSNNHLYLIDPHLGKQTLNKDVSVLPMKLAMGIVHKNGNVIDFKIPITGSLQHPKFKFNQIIPGLIANIFIKHPKPNQGLTIRKKEFKMEKSLSLKWEMRQSELGNNQKKIIKKLGKFLKKNPDAILSVEPHQYAIKEQEYILLFEAKKKFFLETQHKKNTILSEDDSLAIENMSIRNSEFVRYLNSQPNSASEFSIQEKCALLVNASIVNAMFEKLNMDREINFLEYFREHKMLKQLKIKKPKNLIPYNGFSYYKIIYKGEFPPELIKYNVKMND
ncbi:MAG: DUF748 domain-containing protein [Paludibacter sp.]|nr:DUF748 domain-containing protein [Paludibacter sp.]